MALILNIETSTTACSVALARDGEVVGSRFINNGYSHAENLAVFVRDVLEETAVKPAYLDAVAVSKGPGSYTGLRIGVATAKGLAYAHKIPMIAVDTLRSMVVDLLKGNEDVGPGALFCPMLDARRMEVYASLFETNLFRLEPIKAVIVEEDSFFSHLEKQPLYFFGPGADKCEEILGKHSNARFVKERFPTANGMAELAEKAFIAKRFEDVAYFEPFYLKDFIAGKPKSML